MFSLDAPDSKKLTLHTGKSEVMILQKNIFGGPILPVQFGNADLNTPVPLGCSN